MSDLVIDGVSVTHGSTLAVDDVSLRIDRGDLVAVLGPSGCGKTTLLLAIAGLLPIGAGSIRIGSRELSRPGRTVPPEKRGIGWVPQEASLFPHLTVGDNIGFAVPRGRGAASSRERRIAELAELVGLGGLTGRAPNQLSGGQGQRVSLARALAPRPELLLLDEPFAALDTQLRVGLRREVAELLRAQGTTSLLVTHDQEEALTLADKVAVLREGRLEQFGTPAEIYQHPASDWVASFVGDVVELEGRWRGGRVMCALGAVEASAVGFAPADGDPVRLMLRPEWIMPRPELLAHAAAGADARVTAISYAGHDAMVSCEVVGGPSVRMRMATVELPAVGDEVRLAVQRPGLAFPPATPWGDTAD
ncbi:ABC transporter ATP-binding protein [uncultured Schumannella sp.]|uniref:ABC transporter ATP-binding protein n=1 Tax=uncultured Schumannella sp. TaxID=1195956 RepID=UPI0025D91040|nr:ABC transporter ATP-binding protein [uncultured Schumannella sp.]